MINFVHTIDYPMTDQISNIKQKLMPILQRYGIKSASIVGSYARREQSPESDVDIVVEIPVVISLLVFSRIKLEMEEKLKLKVDLIERSAIKPRLKKYLLQDEVSIL